MRTYKYLQVKENREDTPIMPPDMALRLILISSNYPCLEHIFMVPKVFEPLKFYCIFKPTFTEPGTISSNLISMNQTLQHILLTFIVGRAKHLTIADLLLDFIRQGRMSCNLIHR